MRTLAVGRGRAAWDSLQEVFGVNPSMATRRELLAGAVAAAADLPIFL